MVWTNGHLIMFCSKFAFAKSNINEHNMYAADRQYDLNFWLYSQDEDM